MKTYRTKVNSDHGLACRAETRGKEVVMDEPKDLGGTDTGMSPLEIFLSSLGGCLVITAKAYSRKLGVRLKGCRAEVEGDLDPDGFMMKRDDVRSGFQKIRCRLFFDTEASDEKLTELMKLVERTCPVSDTLNGVAIEAVAIRDDEVER